MIRDRLFRTALAAALLGVVPATAAAQDEAAGPEGVDWTLISYYDEETAEMTAVPFEVDATLRLENGVASGSGGCNRFSGDYELEDSSLRFGDEMSVTLAFCDDPYQSVEDVYLAALGEVDGWMIDASVLELNDDFGEVILTFEVPHILWTTTQMNGLMTTLDDLQAEVAALSGDEDIDIAELLDRVKTLETANQKLRKRVTALEKEPEATPAPTPKPGQTASFSKAEKVLLEGIPTRIANYCEPLRAQLPAGARAAVYCTPNTSAVANVSYYLINGGKAAAEFEREMSQFDVNEAASEDETCADDVKSQYWLANGQQAEGCYRHVNRAELRFVDHATDCRQLKVDGKTLDSPAILIALQGHDRDIGTVHAWATRNLDKYPGQMTSITQPIERPKAAISPSCPT